MMNTEKIRLAESFAREVHEGQFRKGVAQEPYAVHLEEVVELVRSYGGNETEICAAWLHDTVEDCPPTSFADIESRFGLEVANIVRELTDDKSLAKPERKRLQVVNAPHKSQSASLVKLCDKTSNLRAIANSPPKNWGYQRRSEYVSWALKVVAALPYKPEKALENFWMAVDRAEITNAEECLPTRQAQNVALAVLERRALRSGASPKQAEEFLVRFIQGTLGKENAHG
jgi:hypothetical protein